MARGFLSALFFGLVAWAISGLTQISSTQPGDEGRLDPEARVVLVSADLESFNNLLIASRANDHQGVTDLLVVGKVLPVDPGTKVQVLASRWEARHVMILEGTFAGRSGWVLSRFVVSTGKTIIDWSFPPAFRANPAENASA